MKKNISFLLFAVLFFGFSCKNTPKMENKTTTTSSETDKKWWKEAIVYQIYPRSFKDSNGDGIGDLKGITSKLDYIKSLGIDCVWLNPIFASPNDDNGYDISDYRGIMKDFGTMEDFDALLKGMHERGIKVVLDLVANHCSDEHNWFKESRKSRDNPYRDYFHWKNAENGKPNARTSFFDINNDAWKLDKATNAYYLHYFSQKQPDLNWENPKVRKEIFDMMNFWFDKGIDGFRMDVISIISKDTTFPPIPEKYASDAFKWYAEGQGGRTHDYLKEMYAQSLSKYNVMSIAEGAGVSAETALDYVDEDRKELNMLYHFEGVDYGYVKGKFKTPEPDGYKLPGFKEIYSKWDNVFAKKGWGTIYLGNHDQPRMLTRWGNDTPEFREASSKMLTTFLMTMRATPYYYFGDELGMSNIKFDNISDYRDIESLTAFEREKKKGKAGDLKGLIEAQKIGARDNGRTPFQWDATANAGFSTAKPWLKTNPNYLTINVEAQEKDQNSILNYFRAMVKLRKSEPTLVYGKYTLLDKENPNVYSYTREYNGKNLLVLLNFSKNTASANTGLDISKAKILINNCSDFEKNGALKAYQAVVLEL